MSDDLPKGPDLSPTSSTGAAGAQDSQMYTDVRQLAQTLAPAPDLSCKLIKGTITAITTASSQTTCTVTLGGDTTTTIPGVRKMDFYSPVVGDVVQIIMQGTEILILGRVDSTTTGSANGWITPSLGSGFSSSANPVQYRVVNDNGDRKVQLRGTLAVSGTPTSIWTMPADVRPSVFKLILAGRDVTGGSNVVQIGISTSGLMSLEGRTTGLFGVSGSAAGRQTDVGGGSAAVTETTSGINSSTYSSGGNPATSGSTVSMDHNITTNEQQNAHQHLFPHNHTVTVNGLAHQHPMSSVVSPTIVYLDGLEYFL